MKKPVIILVYKHLKKIKINFVKDRIRKISLHFNHVHLLINNIFDIYSKYEETLIQILESG